MSCIRVFVNTVAFLGIAAGCTGDSARPTSPASSIASRLEVVAAVPSGQAGSLIGPFVVRAVTTSGEPVAGVAVQWQVDSGVASFEGSDLITSSDGRAAATLRLDHLPGAGHLSVAMVGDEHRALRFPITSQPVMLDELDTLCEGGPSAVLLLIESSLVAELRAQLDRFGADLCASSHTVLELAMPLASPPEVRALLAAVHAQSHVTLDGAMLIGNVPYAYQFVSMEYSNPNIPTLSQEVISFQYYSDLDGRFARSAGYASPSGRAHSFDLHTGAVDWEIWIGVLPPYRGSRASTIEAMKRYFDRNHAHRSEGARQPRRFMQVTELLEAATDSAHDHLMTLLRSGIYSWRPFSEAHDALFYFESPSRGLAVADGYAGLRAGVADFTVVDAHGFSGASGQLTIADVESMPVETTFFWSSGCAIGDLDRQENFLTSILYSPTSAVLVAKGTTNNSGGLGNNLDGFYGRNIATAMSGGQGLGPAILGHVNTPLVWSWSESREFLLGTLLVVGDPTLTLPR